MQEYLLAAAAAGALIEGIDLAHSAARLEMYNAIKNMDTDKRTEIPSDVYSSICFYLLPDGLIKLTKKLPVTCLFDRKIKKTLENKTYNEEPILELLERIENIKWEDIKDKPFIIRKSES
ncbi:MAG: hypothetical protein KKB25_02745 [Nanoarchaeota archaeon]|nr:hypothetical protein [Nanoarchaeota archaeon]